ncbi:MAG TPA: response regulator transcription factor [Candidatus Onthousia excrementipullorum]|uniref:Response regulator transcription factor n=1 Tax=Candidatus Onthousia excrementipullorum TaxID=2840884 RepID=A0A9D1DT39_9FIRM|nr:response regulator transcription factor [Candidatus Onthousia excrementipullorum]
MEKILIVEDDETLRGELSNLLSNSGYEVLVLTDFKNSKEEIIKLNPDLILLDINIPYLNGEVLLKSLRDDKVNTPVIMLTSSNKTIDEVLSISYGADDYITKPYNPTILLLRINNIFKRMKKSFDYLEYDDLKIYPNKGIIVKNGEEFYLTKNEMLIFTYLLNNRGNIVSRDDLMSYLWNSDLYINDNALTVNISRLRAKLYDMGYNDVIVTRKGEGYLLK